MITTVTIVETRTMEFDLPEGYVLPEVHSDPLPGQVGMADVQDAMLHFALTNGHAFGKRQRTMTFGSK